MPEREELPDTDKLLKKAERAVKLLEDGHHGRQELIDLLGEVAADSELMVEAWESAGYDSWQALANNAGALQGTLGWAKKPRTPKPENLLRAQIADYIRAVEDIAKTLEQPADAR